ncbi:MAG: GNAT family N-acetyltransferase [Rhizobiaceae bacterium]
MKHNRTNLEKLQQHPTPQSEIGAGTGDNSPRGQITESDLTIQLSVFSRPAEIQDEWMQFEQQLMAGHSNSNWALAWYAAQEVHQTASPYILVGRNDQGRICFILPLELARVGTMKVLRLPGANQATYCGGLFDKDILSLIENGKGHAFWQAVFAGVGEVDAIVLEGISQQRNEKHHPFNCLPLSSAAHDSMQMAIQKDWPTQYQSMFDGKSRSNDRRVERRLAEMGKLSHLVANSRAERLQLLEVMLAQKAIQFEMLNFSNPYSAPGVANFYRNLINQDAMHAESSLYVSGMMLADRPLAVNFGVIQNSELQGLITSMTSCELRRFSPGRLLMIHTNRHLSDNGVNCHDFGMGEFGYKQEWCDIHVKRQLAMVPFTLPGRAYVLSQKVIQAVKSTLNEHPALKHRLKRLTNNAPQAKK